MITIDTLERYRNIKEPITFMNKDGSLFYSNGGYGCSSFITTFFKVNHVDKKTGCLTLELLRACPDICTNRCNIDESSVCRTCELYRTSDCVTVDPSCFCGVQIHPIPILDALETCKVIKDEICCKFHLEEGEISRQIYENQLDKENSATITIDYNNGSAPFITAKLWIGNMNGQLIEMAMIIEKYKSSSTTVNNIRRIDIMKQIAEDSCGKIKIQLNTIDREIIYF